MSLTRDIIRKSCTFPLYNTTTQEAMDTGWDIVKDGNMEVVAKAVFKNKNTVIMKSTKRMEVPGGWLYMITTEVFEVWEDYGKEEYCLTNIAEAATFVPFKGE